MTRRVFACSLFLCFVGAAAASDGWTGLWRVDRYFEGRVEGTYHLRVSDAAADRVTVYDHEARPMYLQSVSLEGDKLEIAVANSPIQPLPLLFQLTRNEGGLSGEWLFAQFQLADPLRGGASGFQVFSDAEWDPWAAVETHRASRTIDLTGFLADNAPLQDFVEFEGFWRKHVEAPYYFLVESWLYGDGKAPEQARLDKLRALFDLLRKPGPEMEFARRFPEWAESALQLAARSTSAGFQGFLVQIAGPPPGAAAHLWTRTPTPEEEAACACKIDLRETFHFFNAAAFAARRSGATVLVKDMARAAAWVGLSPAISIEVFRQAVALEAAREATGVPPPERDPGAVELFKGLFQDRLLASTESFSAARDERLLAESLAVVLGEDFVAWMRAKHPTLEPAALDPSDVAKGWYEYLLGKPFEAAPGG